LTRGDDNDDDNDYDNDDDNKKLNVLNLVWLHCEELLCSAIRKKISNNTWMTVEE